MARSVARGASNGSSAAAGPKYRVTGREVGQYRIPAFPFEVEGESFITEPIEVTVLDATSDAPIEATVEVDRTTCFVEETVSLTYRILVARDVKVRSIGVSLPILEKVDEFRIKEGPFDKNAKLDSMAVSGYRTSAEVRERRRGGRRFAEYVLRFQLHPPSPGSLTIQPGVAQAEIVVGYRGRTDLFGRRVEETDVRTVSTETVNVEVRPLPSEGRPSGFTGLVGRYSIRATTDVTSVKVGDPIPLRIEVRGDGLMERVPRPDLASLPAFEKFKVDEDLSPGEREDNTLVFERTIRAREASVTEIPPIPLAYFDAEAGRYDVTRSEPIPLSVEETRVVTADQIESPTGAATFAPKRDREQLRGGLNANHVYLDALADQGVDARRLWPLAAGPAVWALLGAFVMLRRRGESDGARARARRAGRRARAALDAAKSASGGASGALHESVSAALQGYVSDVLDLGEGEVTAADVRRHAAAGDLEAGVAERVAELLERCDAGRFGAGAEGGGADLLTEASAVVDAMERGR